MGKGSGQNTVTSTNQPPPQVLGAYQNVINEAQNVANTPLQQYTRPDPGAGGRPDRRICE